MKTNQSKSVKFIPDGYHTITPLMVAKDAARLIEFIEKAFDGKINYQAKTEDGKVLHASIKIGDSMMMLSDATDKFPPMPCILYLYVDDVDAVYKQAINANGISLREPTNEIYGDRSSGIKDAWDNQWWIATHIEDVSDEEMKKREMEFRKK